VPSAAAAGRGRLRREALKRGRDELRSSGFCTSRELRLSRQPRNAAAPLADEQELIPTALLRQPSSALSAQKIANNFAPHASKR
jgi:hypothetical protein